MNNKRIINMLLAVFVVLFMTSCVSGTDSIREDDYTYTEETSFAVSGEASVNETESLKETELKGDNEDLCNVLPLMIYYNDTIYYLKDELFVITDDKLRASQIDDNFESIGTIETIVPSNKRPTVNFSANFGDEASFFDIYKYSDDDSEFITALWGHIQVWETEERHNLQ